MLKKISLFVVVALMFSFAINLNVAQATYLESSSDDSVVNSISLSGSGDSISWTVDGYSSKGFKVVWSKNANPTYPTRSGDKYHYYSSPDKLSDTLTAFNGDGTYYVRVCEYLGGKCGTYSNQITLTLGDEEESSTNTSEDVISITVSGDNEDISWSVDGYSDQGFKVVWSKNANPTYPTRSGDKYHYYSSSSKRDDTLTAFDGAGTYYVRVCEYLGGACGTYSNQITVTLGDSTEEEESSSSEAEDVESITLSADGSNVSWTVDGYSEKGFKVVWSMTSGPTYPTRDGNKYHYYSSPTKRSDTLSAFDGTGIYYVRVCEYLGGSCGTYSNEVTVELTAKESVQAKVQEQNKNQEQVQVKDEQIEQIEEAAKSLFEDKIDSLLSVIEELKDIVKEQASQIKYLLDLTDGVQALSSKVEEAINTFITYGVDENTKNLGAGERAAVMYSYKAAFGELPDTEDEMADAIKIANGRWPSVTSEEAEAAALETFETIYGREADMDNANDNAAVTIMAYGLRQRAENRNLNSERNGIKIFEGIFGHTPSTTEEWNIMQAITYSGASK